MQEGLPTAVDDVLVNNDDGTTVADDDEVSRTLYVHNRFQSYIQSQRVQVLFLHPTTSNNLFFKFFRVYRVNIYVL